MTFQVEKTEDGTFDVTDDGRAVFYDALDLDDAERVVRENGGDEYVLIHEDGYRTTERI